MFLLWIFFRAWSLDTDQLTLINQTLWLLTDSSLFNLPLPNPTLQQPLVVPKVLTEVPKVLTETLRIKGFYVDQTNLWLLHQNATLQQWQFTSPLVPSVPDQRQLLHTHHYNYTLDKFMFTPHGYLILSFLGESLVQVYNLSSNTVQYSLQDPFSPNFGQQLYMTDTHVIISSFQKVSIYQDQELILTLQGDDFSFGKHIFCPNGDPYHELWITQHHNLMIFNQWQLFQTLLLPSTPSQFLTLDTDNVLISCPTNPLADFRGGVLQLHRAKGTPLAWKQQYVYSILQDQPSPFSVGQAITLVNNTLLLLATSRQTTLLYSFDILDSIEQRITQCQCNLLCLRHLWREILKKEQTSDDLSKLKKQSFDQCSTL